MPNDIRPYFVPSDTAVTWQQWSLLSSGVWIELPEYVEGWQPGEDLDVACDFAIDVDALARETRRDACSFVVTLSWVSSTTGMLGSTSPLLIPESGKGRIEAELSGDRIGGVLTLRSGLVLKLTDSGTAPLGSAHIAGSVMAEERRSLTLEREVRMFPITKVDFARTQYSPDASWHLELDGDFETPHLAAIMLLINSRDTALCEAISDDLKNDSQTLIYEELEQGVASLLFELALLNRDELLAATWPADSVGDVLRQTLELSQISDLPSLFGSSISDFRTAIAGAVRKSGHGRMFR